MPIPFHYVVVLSFGMLKPLSATILLEPICHLGTPCPRGIVENMVQTQILVPRSI